MPSGLSLRKKNTQKAPPQLADVLQPYMECCICYGTLYNAASCTPCLHTFCMGCISRWADTNNGKCPMCRISVKEITPNWVLRDLVKNYLLVRPEQKRLQSDMEILDQAELEYILKWLGSTDDRFLEIESMASLQGAPERCDQKYNNMMTRAVELIKKAVCKGEIPELDAPITVDIIKPALELLVKDLKNEIMPATIFTKYHRLERAYRKIVKISIPKIGPAEHTWLGNYFFDRDFMNPELSGSDVEFSDDEDGYDPGITARISDVISDLRNPTLPPRRQPRPQVQGFDPAVLEALARVHTMRAPGFRRQPPPLPPIIERPSPLPPRSIRTRTSNNSTVPSISEIREARRRVIMNRSLYDFDTAPASDAPAPEQSRELHRLRRAVRLAARPTEA